MPKPQLRISEMNHPEVKLLREENAALRQEVNDLRAQLAAIRVGIGAIMDSITTPGEHFEQ